MDASLLSETDTRRAQADRLFSAATYADWVREGMRLRAADPRIAALFESTICAPFPELVDVVRDAFSLSVSPRYVSARVETFQRREAGDGLVEQKSGGSTPRPASWRKRSASWSSAVPKAFRRDSQASASSAVSIWASLSVSGTPRYTGILRDHDTPAFCEMTYRLGSPTAP